MYVGIWVQIFIVLWKEYFSIEWFQYHSSTKPYFYFLIILFNLFWSHAWHFWPLISPISTLFLFLPTLCSLAILCSYRRYYLCIFVVLWLLQSFHFFWCHISIRCRDSVANEFTRYGIPGQFWFLHFGNSCFL